MSIKRILIYVTIFATTCAWSSTTNMITLENPRGGEVYTIGQTQFVRIAKTRFRNVIIELSRDGGQTYSNIGVIDGFAKDREQRSSVSFTVSGPASSNCLIRAHVTLKDGESKDISGGFSIVETLTGGLSATGTAGGDLTGTYPSPSVAPKAVTAMKIGSEVASTDFLLAADGIGGARWIAPATTARPTGSAGGDLSGIYPNPTIAPKVVSSSKIDSATVASNFVLAADGNGGAKWVSPGTFGLGSLILPYLADDASGSVDAFKVTKSAGSGSAGRFENTNPTNPDAAFVSFTAGGGDAGVFRVTNSASLADAILAEMDGNGNVIITRHSGSSGDHLRCQSNGPNFTTVARIDLNGKGIFNGGVDTSSLTLTGPLTIPTTTRFYSISHQDFTRDSTNNTNLNRRDSDLLFDAGSNDITAHAAVKLPHGAIVTEVLFYFIDNDNTHDIEVSLERTEHATGTLSNIVTVQSTGTSASVRNASSAALAHVVDNQNYAYSFRLKLFGPSGSPSYCLYSARITYTVQTPLP